MTAAVCREQADRMDALHALVDETILCIGRLQAAEADRKHAERFCGNLEAISRLLRDQGHADLSACADDIRTVFRGTSRLNRQKIYGVLTTALSFMGLARKTIMFSDTPDFTPVASEMLAMLKNSLGQLG